MSIVKTQEEYEEMKKDFTNKIDKFLLDFNEFSRKTSPKYWRSFGDAHVGLRNIKDRMKEYTPLKMKHLEVDFVRDDVLNDKEKEIYNQTKKYNL